MRPPSRLVLLVCWLAVAAVEPGDRAPLPRPLASAVSDAVATGADRVRRAALPADGRAPFEGATGHPLEDAALSLRAMAAAGTSPNDAGYASALAVVRSAAFDDVHAVAACVVALGDHGDAADHARIAAGVGWLAGRRDERGLWRGATGRTDVEASEQAVTALEVGRRVGHAAPLGSSDWVELADAALELRLDDGAFGASGVARGDVTASAIVLLERAHRRLVDADAAPGVRRRAAGAISDAWAWLDERFTVVGAPVGPLGLARRRVDGAPEHHRYLDAVSRAADVAGRATIGGRDWAADASLELLRGQGLDGGWGGLTDTCLAVVFLARALGPPGELDDLPASAAWRVTSRAPSGPWTSPAFDDATWALGHSAFASERRPGVDVRGWWPTGRSALWMRRPFTWRDGDPEPSFAVRHDGPLELFVNGVVVGRWSEGTGGRRVVHPLSPAARRMLRAGDNVAAAWARREHDDQVVHVELLWGDVAPSPTPWWRLAAGPRPDASFVRRWLTAGPVVEQRPERLAALRLDGAELSPRVGQRTRQGRWEETLAPGGYVDLVAATSDADASLRYAFTWLHAEADVDAVLWIGSDDGVRVWLDGRPVHSHHRMRRARVDEDAIALSLGEGPHRLLFEIDNREGTTGLFARLTDPRGEPLRDVRPALRDERPNWSAVALAHPELFSYAELHTLLTPARADRLDFAKSDVRADGLAMGPTHPDSSTWLPRGIPARASGDPTSRPPDTPHIPVSFGKPLPHPGARGVLELRPPTRGVPARLLRRVTLGEAITARVCADATADPTHAGATLRIGVWTPDGAGAAPTWLHESTVTSTETPSQAQWVDVTVPTGGLAGEDVLVVIEAVASPAHVGPDTLFLDELSFR